MPKRAAALAAAAHETDSRSRGVVVRIRRDADLHGVVRCFTESVHVIGARYYNSAQIAVWAPDNADEASWRTRLSTGMTWVADVGGAVTGFVRLEPVDFIDLLYVHPAYERRGIGTALLCEACSWAGAHGAERIEANVSLAAKPLFEALTFRVTREQSVEYKGIIFRNFRMARDEAAATEQPAGRTTRAREEE
jgi:putative acetyltransferase